jgi:hypothetical protein
MRIRYRGNLFTEQLPSNSQGFVDMFIGRYQATHAPRDRCIATAVHAYNTKVFFFYFSYHILKLK